MCIGCNEQLTIEDILFIIIYNNRLFIALHLMRAQSAYKDIRIHSFHHTHTHIQLPHHPRCTCAHSQTHIPKYTHTHHMHTYTHILVLILWRQERAILQLSHQVFYFKI